MARRSLLHQAYRIFFGVVIQGPGKHVVAVLEACYYRKGLLFTRGVHVELTTPAEIPFSQFVLRLDRFTCYGSSEKA
jgi:hypothetical protein